MNSRLSMVVVFAVVAFLSLATAQAGTVTQIGVFGTGGTEGIGSYTGSIKYDTNDDITGLLDISLTNTSTFGNGGFITGLVFNIAGNANATYQPIGGDSFSNLTNPSASPFGQFEEGAAIGGSFTGGGNPTTGVAFGDSRTFRFNVIGPDVASLTASSFFSELSAGASSDWGGQVFAVRFKGYEPNGSDKVPGYLIPTPAAAGAGLALFGLMGLRRRA